MSTKKKTVSFYIVVISVRVRFDILECVNYKQVMIVTNQTLRDFIKVSINRHRINASSHVVIHKRLWKNKNWFLMKKIAFIFNERKCMLLWLCFRNGLLVDAINKLLIHQGNVYLVFPWVIAQTAHRCCFPRKSGIIRAPVSRAANAWVL